MPVLPPLAPPVGDSVNSILNAARVRLNDVLETLYPLSGKLLKNNSIFTLQVVNNAWRKMQEYLANIGFTGLKQEEIIYGLPIVASLDPAIQVRIDWFNYFDGQNLYDTPRLPQDLIIPLKLYERPTAQNCPFDSGLMELMVDGLKNSQKGTASGSWEWRAQSIYMPGSLQVMDLRLLYMRYLPDFADTDQQWQVQKVPLIRCQDCFSLFICAEIAETRGDLDTMTWIQKAQDSGTLMVNRDVQMKQRTNVRRQSRSGRLEYGNGFGCWDGY